jgi:tetratricopeptide (TPR) repeat protein
MALNDLANQQKKQGQVSESLGTHERSLEIRRRLAIENPEVAEYQKELGIGLMNCANLRRNAGRGTEAMPLYEEARGLYQALIRKHPGVADYRARLSSVYFSIGLVHEMAGRTDEVLQAVGRTRELLEGVVCEHPEDLASRASLGQALRWIGQVYQRRTNHHLEAIPCYRRAIELFERLMGENPEVKTYPLPLAYSYCYLGQVMREAGRGSEAMDLSQRALSMFDRIDQQGLADLYDLACVRSLSSDLVLSSATDPSTAERSRRLADRAMEALRQAITGGYHDVDWIEHDTDLDPLRSRDDYKALIADLKSRVASSKRHEETAKNR